jgi:hypothetical protein
MQRVEFEMHLEMVAAGSDLLAQRRSNRDPMQWRLPGVT